jgi:hypothetical protein
MDRRRESTLKTGEGETLYSFCRSARRMKVTLETKQAIDGVGVVSSLSACRDSIHSCCSLAAVIFAVLKFFCNALHPVALEYRCVCVFLGACLCLLSLVIRNAHHEEVVDVISNHLVEFKLSRISNSVQKFRHAPRQGSFVALAYIWLVH